MFTTEKTGRVVVAIMAVCIMPAHAGSTLTASLVRGEAEAQIIARPEGGLRSYELTSTVPLRDNLPAGNRMVFSEESGQPVVRTGNVMFDGLYAMAVHEAQQNSVSEIRDHAYSNGEPIRIEAFQTGEKWTYVWTRDLAYSVNLSLAGFDPQRSVDSLLFKTSSLKSSVSDGFKHQIIQDTGSGGSYPVSTDRVVWALGAWETLKHLSGAERETFLKDVYPILRDTIEQDRILVYDPRDGLYRGEQSFLDWREQTYPGWTRDDVLPIAMSKSLSVNVLNYYLLNVASECAVRLNQHEESARYRKWASGLKDAINAYFYDEDDGLYSAYLLSDGLCNVNAKRYDLLGESLAILFGVADEEQARSILNNYPVGPHGPSVVWPQERTVPIYHNQGIWPFVTAYWIKAASKAGHAAALEHGVLTMQRLAAFNLSNMENYDFVSGLAEVRNKPLSGPVINSRRQLWSVAGYLSMIQDVLFGVETQWDGIRFRPRITTGIRSSVFGTADAITMQHFEYRGTRSTIRIHLPPVSASEQGIYEIESVMLNGEAVDGEWVPVKQLQSSNRWDIHLQSPDAGAEPDTIRLVDVRNDRILYGPVQPAWVTAHNGGVTVEDGRLKLHFTHPDPAGVVFNIYRNGKLAAGRIRASSWVDEQSLDHMSVAHCYTVEAIDPKTGNSSHLTPFICYSPEEEKHIIQANEMKNRGGSLVSGHHFADWGDPRHELLTRPLAIDQSGRYRLRLEFSNGSGPVNTGITCAIKALEVVDDASGRVVATGYVIMPQSGNWQRWDLSSPVMADLEAGREYRFRIREDEYSRNMSYLQQNERYTALPGGGDDGYNYVNIASLHVDMMVAEGAGPDRLTSNP
jgi:hypothetical protein